MKDENTIDVARIHRTKTGAGMDIFISINTRTGRYVVFHPSYSEDFGTLLEAMTAAGVLMMKDNPNLPQ